MQNNQQGLCLNAVSFAGRHKHQAAGAKFGLFFSGGYLCFALQNSQGQVHARLVDRDELTWLKTGHNNLAPIIFGDDHRNV